MTGLRHLYDRAVAGPVYPPDARDREDVRLFGLAFPLRAGIAVLVMTVVVVADMTGLLLRGATGPEGPSSLVGPVPLSRFVLYLVVPLAVVLLVFRDDRRRYGLGLGDWRWGLAMLLAGIAVMTPIILGLSGLEAFRQYYGASARPLAAHLAGNLVELVPAEFLLRGFLMFALWRRIGPLALVVALIPFVLTHVGKPDLELWSTFVGGSVFAWLDWRTGSILWSALGHVYVLTLMTVAVGGATFG